MIKLKKAETKKLKGFNKNSMKTTEMHSIFGGDMYLQAIRGSNNRLDDGTTA